MMIRNFGVNAARAALVAAFAVVLAAPMAAQAQVSKPFKVVGAGSGPDGLPLPGQDPRPHWAIGEATHLGRYYGAGTVQTDTAVPDFANGTITGEFGSGPEGFTFVAANGDKLATQYGRVNKGASQPGTFTLTILAVQSDGSLIVQALFIAEFVPQPEKCTGRFAGVTGGWVMIAQSAPFVLGSSDPVDYTWKGEGTLIFPKKSN